MRAKTGVGRIRELMKEIQAGLPEGEFILLTVAGDENVAAELYILNKPDGKMTTIRTFKTIREMNRWALQDIRRMMEEFIVK